jgi:alcohol dehydrogenase (NADP+)
LKQKASLICTSSDAKYPNGDLAHGGYSDGVRAHERFVFPIPDGVDLADAGTFVSTSCHCLSSVRLLSLAPMLCGGLTTFSPLVRNGCGTTAKKVAVVGIGGLYIYIFFLIYAYPDQYLHTAATLL